MPKPEICGCSQSEALKTEAEVYRKALEQAHKDLGDIRRDAVIAGATACAMTTFGARERISAALNAVRS